MEYSISTIAKNPNASSEICPDISIVLVSWNNREYFSKDANEYWQDVDLYIGGDEHGTGHLIYARFWSMFLYDIGLACKAEPFKKLINQGKIQGRSSFAYRIKDPMSLYHTT